MKKVIVIFLKTKGPVNLTLLIRRRFFVGLIKLAQYRCNVYFEATCSCNISLQMTFTSEIIDLNIFYMGQNVFKKISRNVRGLSLGRPFGCP